MFIERFAEKIFKAPQERNVIFYIRLLQSQIILDAEIL